MNNIQDLVATAAATLGADSSKLQGATGKLLGGNLGRRIAAPIVHPERKQPT